MTGEINRRDFLTTTTTAAGLSAISAGAFAGEDSQADLKKIGRTPHTKFAVNMAMWFRRLPFLERIRRAAALGFPAVEFWPWQGKDIDAAATLCKSLGIAVAQFTAWGFRPGLNETKNHKAFVQARFIHTRESPMARTDGGARHCRPLSPSRFWRRSRRRCGKAATAGTRRPTAIVVPQTRRRPQPVGTSTPVQERTRKVHQFTWRPWSRPSSS